MFTFFVNGKKVVAEKDEKLIFFLRNTLHLTSVKNGCAEGSCGACTVLLDGRPVKSCCRMLSSIEEKRIVTVEGLSDREKSVYAWAFSTVGAVQCGFCTPGMVISAKALIDSCPANAPVPDATAIKNAIRTNICRCTGYIKIEQAIGLAAAALADGREVLPVQFAVPGFSTFEDKTLLTREGKHITGRFGESMPRTDAAAKVLGIAQYCDDLYIDGMIYGGAVRSSYPRAKVVSIDIRKAESLLGVVGVYTWDDLPGVKITGHLKQDWDVLIRCGCETHYLGDAIVLVAAVSPDILTEAKSLVEIEYEELPPVRNPSEARTVDAPRIHPDGNLLDREVLQRGNAEKKIAEAAYVVSRHYSTPFTEHAFLEPETAVAVPSVGISGKVESLTIYSGDQGIYQTKKECTPISGLPPDKVTVIAKMVGGGFGGKEDMSVQHHAAVLAVLTGRPVKVSLSRQESIIVHPKRHAMEIDMTTACDANGKLLAMKARITSDTGAYASLGGPVLQRACTHAAGPYNFQDVDIVGEAWYTNNPPAGAFRGFGVPQSCFAAEQNMNLLAQEAGIDPWEFRYRNAIRPGQVLPNGQIADETTAFVETLEAVKPFYDAHPGCGIACAMKNSGLGVGIPDAGRCRLVVKNGKVHIYSSAACIGQGMGTVQMQIVCETAALHPCFVAYEPPNTDLAPDAGNTTASRQTLFTGEAAARAAEHLYVEMLKAGYEPSTDGDPVHSNTAVVLSLLDGKEFFGEYLGVTDKMGSKRPNPMSHIAYGYATHVVDLDTDGKVRNVVAAHDAGCIVNPASIEGQIQGGVVMSLGYALTEDYPLENCVPKARFATLGLFRSTQVPEIRTILCGKGEGGTAVTVGCKPALAYGAKGIGEICAIPTAPAVAHAYMRLDGEFRSKLPLCHTPYSRKKDSKN